MPRAPTGSAVFRSGRWWARVTLADGTRHRIPLPPELAEGDAARAKALATAISAEVRAGRYQPPGAPPAEGETCAEWFTRWLAAREARGLTSVRDDRGRWAQHIAPVLGEVRIAAITRADVERVVLALDEKVRGGRLHWKTAANTWGLLTKALHDASHAKDPALRVLPANPAAGVEGPDRGVRRGKVYLYPSELQALVACPGVPLRWRRLYALAVYTFTRAGELRGLQCDAVDAEHGTLHIHRSLNVRRGGLKSTKTGEARRFAVEPAVLPLLRHLVGGRTAGPVLGDIASERALSKMLRVHLRRAGVARAELFATDETHKQLTFHDLRATGITWMAVRGDSPLQIRHRAGHTDFQTTSGYIREGEAVREGFGVVFPALPAELCGDEGGGPEGGESAQGSGPSGGPVAQNPSDSRTMRGRRGRDSNPRGTARTAEIPGDSAPRPPAERHGKTPSDTFRPSPGPLPGPVPSPRAVLVGQLLEAVRAATAGGDEGAARVAAEALAKLLGG